MMQLKDTAVHGHVHSPTIFSLALSALAKQALPIEGKLG
jgi:hypothetical protein